MSNVERLTPERGLQPCAPEPLARSTVAQAIVACSSCAGTSRVLPSMHGVALLLRPAAPSLDPAPTPCAPRRAATKERRQKPEEGTRPFGRRRVQARGQRGTAAPQPLGPGQMEPPRQCLKRSISRAIAAPSSASVREESESVFVRAASEVSSFDERREEPALSSLISSVPSSCSRWR